MIAPDRFADVKETVNEERSDRTFGGCFSGAERHREQQVKYAGNRKTIPVIN